MEIYHQGSSSKFASLGNFPSNIEGIYSDSLNELTILKIGDEFSAKLSIFGSGNNESCRIVHFAEVKYKPTNGYIELFSPGGKSQTTYLFSGKISEERIEGILANSSDAPTVELELDLVQKLPQP